MHNTIPTTTYILISGVNQFDVIASFHILWKRWIKDGLQFYDISLATPYGTGPFKG